MPSGLIRGRHTESVFALSLTENVEVFKKQRDNEQHSFLFRLCGKGMLCPTYLISIRVWGIVSFIVVKVFPQPSVR